MRATATAFIAMSKIRPLCENEKSSSEAWLSRKRSPDTRSTPKELFSAITIKRGQIQCVAFLTERVVEGITHTQNSQKHTKTHTHNRDPHIACLSFLVLDLIFVSLETKRYFISHKLRPRLWAVLSRHASLSRRGSALCVQASFPMSFTTQ